MKNLSFLLIVCIFFFSCKKDKEVVSPSSLNGIFIVNEGNFLSGDASVSFWERSTGNLIQKLNSFDLGDVALSMTIHNGRGYIVVNNSQKVQVVSMENFSDGGEITGLSSPRYFLPLNKEKGYITDWLSDAVKVVDLNSRQIIKSIPTGGVGPEQMAFANDKLYVVNVGAYGDDSTLTVINTQTDTVLKTVIIGIDPNSIVHDKNGKLWILCNGDTGPDWIGTADDIAGSLLRINPENDSIEFNLNFSQIDHPSKLTISPGGDVLYFLNGLSGFDGKIFTMNINDNFLPNQPFIDKIFYGLGIDPVTNQILGAYVPGFSQQGYMFRYNSNGTFIDSMKVGIGPNGFAFN